MNCLFRKLFACVLASSILLAPATSRAGLTDLFGHLSSWWNAGSIGAHSMDGDGEVSDPMPEEEDGSDGESGEVDEGGDDDPSPGNDDAGGEGNSDSGSGGTPGMCLVPQELPKTECDVGSGFLCVTTPPGGIAGQSFVLTGTIDRQSSTLASIQIIAQNEYTKEMASVDTGSPESGVCDGNFDGEFCLDAEGRYAARIALAENGPYTVMVTASRLSGDSVTKQVRTSRVIPTEFSSDDVSFSPNVAELSSIDSTHVTVTVDLLGDCQFCDFIGASTGGVAVSVENVITDSDGVERRISCATTMEQGGQGRFVLGVPAGSGQNSFTIRACNAAAMNASCPTVSGVTFSATGVVDASEAVEFVSPEPLPSYDKDAWPTIPWKFRIAGQDRCVGVRLNRQVPQEICPDASGLYSMDVKPREGINVASITSETGTDEFAWTFGWGKILSPHADRDGRIHIPSAVELGLTAHAAKGILLPAFNNYLASDEFGTLLNDMLSDMGDKSTASEEDDEILDLIPKCKSSGGGDFTVELRGKPDLGDVLLKSLAFEQDELGLKLVLKDTEVGLDVIPKKNLPPLPLVIMIRKAVLDVELETDRAKDGGPRILVTSPHEDCDYKSGTYCKHIPAPLIPKNIVGGANSYGGFMKCDMSLAEGKAKEACSAINSLNAQTGILSEVVLDALNEALYCGGSAALTGAARNGIDVPPVYIGCDVRGGCTSGVGTIVPRIRIPIGVNFEDGLEISKYGILVDAGLSFGDGQTYSNTPAEVQIESAGIIASAGLGESSLASPGGFGGDLNAAVSLDAVNALLFTATAQGDGRHSFGALDIDVHEPFFNKLDFDFVKECDAYEIPVGGEDDRSTLCNIRPRVSELLGTALTTYGYLPGNHPLMMAIRGNRALGPRVAVVDLDDLPLVVQDEGVEGGEGASTPTGSLLAIDIGGLTLAFYALEVDEAAGLDEYGNPALELDANGNPIIMSMRPDDPDPLNGAIISFDLTLLLGAEVGRIEPDPEDAGSFRIKLGILGDRSRLVLTPIPGTNATTVPAAGLVSSLSEKLKYAIVELEEFDIPIPREIALEADDDGVFGMLGLAKIGFGDDGLSLDFDPTKNKVELAVSAIITQILHRNGEEKKYTLP
jgi:hypothetical protein